MAETLMASRLRLLQSQSLAQQGFEAKIAPIFAKVPLANLAIMSGIIDTIIHIERYVIIME
jgi:hypothetical protein